MNLAHRIPNNKMYYQSVQWLISNGWAITPYSDEISLPSKFVIRDIFYNHLFFSKEIPSGPTMYFLLYCMKNYRSVHTMFICDSRYEYKQYDQRNFNLFLVELRSNIIKSLK